MGEIAVRPGDDLSTLSKANPAGTVFRLQPGVYSGQSVTPKDDQQFIGEPGVILDGAGREFAFGGVRGGTGGKRVQLRDLGIRGYAPTAQNAAIRPFGYAYDWLLEDCDIHHNANWGVQVDSGWKARRCGIHHNGTLGLGGGGNAQTVIENCAIYGNNTSGADSHWEGGGMKFVYSSGLTVRDCDVFENDGPGIWYDGHSTDAQIIRNSVCDNRGPGIDYEINAGALIEGNQCEGNGTDPTWADDYDLGGGGILIIDCSGVTIRNNILLDNQGGIGLVDDARSGRDQWPLLEGIDVYGNLIRYAARKTGIAIAAGRPALAASVRFHDNRYQIDPSRIGFRIGSSNLSFPQWQAKFTGEQLDDEQEERGMSNFGAIAGLSVTGVKGPASVVKPGKPTGLEAYRALDWDAVPGADFYRVQAKVGTADWVFVCDTVESHTDVPRRCRYRVRALNAAGGSPWAYLLV